MKSLGRIVIEKPNGRFASLFLGAWLVPWAVITGTMLYGIIFDNQGRTDEYLTILTPLLFIGLIAIRLYVWNLRGRDEIEFLNRTIKLSRKGSFLHLPATELSYTDLNGFALADFQSSPLWAVLWGVGGDRIVADCGYYERRIGQGLSKQEAQRFVDLLNTRLSAAKFSVESE